MTVKELIEELKKMPSDETVFVDEYEIEEVIKTHDGVHIWQLLLYLE